MTSNDYKALIWDKRNKGQGEPYKRFVLDPLILKLAQPIKNKVVLEQGCGNGHLGRKIAEANPQKIILIDYYQGNLDCAKINLEKCKCPVDYIKADLNKKINFKSATVDIVTSSMVLSEIKNLQMTIKETARLLRKNGVYIMAVIHPALTLKKYLQEKITGQKAKKIIPSRNYFDESKSNFMLGLDTHQIIKAPHYNRTIETYITSLIKAGFKLETFLEPKVNNNLLKNAPRFQDDTDCPISFIIKAVKI